MRERTMMGNEMEWLSTSSVVERAKEELEILENEHPNSFHYLKSELQILISNLQSHYLPPTSSSSSSALTQESSTSKKRKANRSESNENSDDAHMPKIHKVKSSKIDAVLERAQQCIHKIRRFKATL